MLFCVASSIGLHSGLLLLPARQTIQHFHSEEILLDLEITGFSAFESPAANPEDTAVEPDSVEVEQPSAPASVKPAAAPVTASTKKEKKPVSGSGRLNTVPGIASSVSQTAKIAPGKARAPSLSPGNPVPPYPSLARKRNQEGLVLIKCQINETGEATACSIEKSSGYRLLDDAALKTVRNWKFQPAWNGGKTTQGAITVPVEFKLY